MPQTCPHCKGSRFDAGTFESAAPVELQLADGRRCAVQALVCQDCGFVELFAARASVDLGAEPEDVQEYDF